jgi:hypothetical protein
MEYVGGICCHQGLRVPKWVQLSQSRRYTEIGSLSDYSGQAGEERSLIGASFRVIIRVRAVNVWPVESIIL